MVKVFLDLDGVLTDFDKRFEENDKGLTMKQYIEKFGIDAAWQTIHVRGEVFWSEMEWKSDGKQLWENLKDMEPIIISSPSRLPCSRSGKTKWIERELGIKANIVTRIEDFSDKHNVVYTRHKYLFAKKYPDSILIDDWEKNTDKWPGKFILHKNTEKTLNSFKKLK